VLNAIKEKYQSFDIVIDDGSHYSPHMLASFVMLYESVSTNGVYFVEDTNTNYWPEYGGGVQMPGTFVEFAKQKIDELNAAHTRGVIQPSVITVSTNSMCFYDSVIVFEKRMQGFRQDAITNGIFFPNDR
jgi:cephalosporin hydroxylase